MNRKRFLGICLIFLMVAFTLIQPAYSGPGGRSVKLMAGTFWGKMALAMLTFNLLPIGIWLYFKQRLAERRALQGLKRMARVDSNFSWPAVRRRIQDCFYRVHQAWNEEDVTETWEYTTDWYWHNRQLVHLDRLHREGMRNVCEVRKVRKIRPLFFHRNDGNAHEASVLVVSITASMQDYLVQRESGAVVEGHRRFKDRETIWTFALAEGQWKVSNIEESGCEFDYIFQVKNMPGRKEVLPGQMDPITTGDRQINIDSRITSVAASR